MNGVWAVGGLSGAVLLVHCCDPGVRLLSWCYAVLLVQCCAMLVPLVQCCCAARRTVSCAWTWARCLRRTRSS